MASRPLSSVFMAFSVKLTTPLLLRSPFTFSPHFSLRFLSTTATPYPLYYELIRYRPVRPPQSSPRRSFPENIEPPSSSSSTNSSSSSSSGDPASAALERCQRKYLRKRMKRMCGGTEIDNDDRFRGDELVELEPEIIDFPRLHAREEELYFHDAFALPWEKGKHYRMVYRLEKKYFPDHCLDKAFVDPIAEPVSVRLVDDGEKKRKGNLDVGRKNKNKNEGGMGKDEKNLIFFEEQCDPAVPSSTVNRDVSAKKVAELFKSLKKAPSAGGPTGFSDDEGGGEPYLVTTKSILPPRWDGPHGTVVLVNKPKGWTSFTVCGKLRSLVKVQKVGHAGTLDPMATGLLIVCVGKATKLVDRYQGMVKGYSGTFRLGEATSTWDAESPVIQREPWEHIKDDDIKKAAASFCGEIYQVPPMFSAIKVNGEKMYDKARRGEMVELSPRRISIFDFAIERSLEDRQNLVFRVKCSKGTYIRSLCADLGKALGSCAHLRSLRRDSIGEYSVNDAWNFPELQEAIAKGYF